MIRGIESSIAISRELVMESLLRYPVYLKVLSCQKGSVFITGGKYVRPTVVDEKLFPSRHSTRQPPFHNMLVTF